MLSPLEIQQPGNLQTKGWFFRLETNPAIFLEIFQR